MDYKKALMNLMDFICDENVIEDWKSESLTVEEKCQIESDYSLHVEEIKKNDKGKT